MLLPAWVQLFLIGYFFLPLLDVESRLFSFQCGFEPAVLHRIFKPQDRIICLPFRGFCSPGLNKWRFLWLFSFVCMSQLDQKQNKTQPYNYRFSSELCVIRSFYSHHPLACRWRTWNLEKLLAWEPLQTLLNHADSKLLLLPGTRNPSCFWPCPNLGTSVNLYITIRVPSRHWKIPYSVVFEEGDLYSLLLKSQWLEILTIFWDLLTLKLTVWAPSFVFSEALKK